uniref:Amidohydrolase family protein n=1 Tax=Phenylobacterium glaciei TaxID=2803784 RepID=A0A974P249_9CAUL|nr:amidohydrolase family protein [Phenylobacterium glaciei]
MSPWWTSTGPPTSPARLSLWGPRAWSSPRGIRRNIPQPQRPRPLWAVAQEAGVPILFHVGGEEKMHKAYLENGGPQVLDFHGGAENFTSLTFMTIPLSVWQTLSALVIDGVFDRFPNLKFGAIELGPPGCPV